MADWAAQSLRVVWFGSGVDNNAADLIFHRAFGIEAETINRNRVPGPINPFWSQASGGVGEVIRGEIQVGPGRVDVALHPHGDEATPTLDLKVIDEHYERVCSTLVDLGNALRLAIVVDAVKLQETYHAAIGEIAVLTQFSCPLDDILDFSLQLNKRRLFRSTDNISMNRLLRWATATYQFIRFEMPSGSMAATPVASLRHATSVQIDLNSVPTEREISSREQFAMYTELKEEASRLARNPSLGNLVEIYGD